ncbi:hypothetical protein BDY17DRAFT_312525 [Neohortaea acidophila]|uniref:Uncharacterized protein n=1 Tax=Neohortaea acidophila TaxID=245834 RepID=A0A6A6PL69_9PEZI|nr:uncharacterized protein BDY17DRAFT_312525 [Neohortaea acidophila]KAF2480675.1 hypothetical protein BDY17DRAFT_312525 [Neohortaea acidophila]
MDPFDLQQELEALAGNAYNPDLAQQDTPEPISATIKRWQTLFGLSSGDAIDSIMAHRNNLTRARISDDHWQMVQRDKEAQGYDREAYEHELDVQKKKATVSNLLPTSEAVATAGALTYLVQLNGPLATPETVKRVTGMTALPVVVRGESVEDGRAVSLCCVDEQAKQALLHWAASEGNGFEPTLLVNPRSLR